MRQIALFTGVAVAELGRNYNINNWKIYKNSCLNVRFLSVKIVNLGKIINRYTVI
jgi:hypothetical protein